ncbi:energy transducer TonB [Halomonas denitrificans]|uniref:energy transducer TonB n=1 Tax=Halomonas denitrificans TaxID=370769 RepID=UPI001C999BF8|nr:energy transducer TonB [Halomonas denitrificans]MBY5969415.1 TonB family protein [Halomonas denitrificans]
MRRVGALIAGGLLTLALFALLALLVLPPESEPELREEITLSLAEPVAPQAEAPAESSAASSAAPPPPPPVQAAPAPPAPAQSAVSEIRLPDPEVVPPKREVQTLDSRLPELTETPPEPKPQPRPEPRPEPQPEPQPRPEPTPQPVATPAPSPSPSPTQASSGSGSAASAGAGAAAPASNEPVDVGTSARATRKVPPEYPRRAQRRGLEGYVVMQFIIRSDGSVDRGSIQVVDASPRRVFEDAARQAIAGWQFETASGLRRARQRLEFQLR